MKKLTFSNLLIAGLLAFLSLGWPSLPVSASGAVAPNPVPSSRHQLGVQGKFGTTIVLTKLPPTGLGEPFSLEGLVKDSLGRPVQERSILIDLDGIYLGQVKTNADGTFQRNFTKNLDAGSYSIKAYWHGTPEYAASSTTATLEITPAEVRIQTVPAIAGLPFTMANQRVVSGKDGLAIVKINKAGAYSLNVLVDQYHNDTQRITFGRWLNESYEPTNIIQVPSKKVIQVGLNVFRLVGQSFVDLDGYPVDPKRITEFMIRSAQGDVFIFHDGQPRWIPASRIARRVTGLEEAQLLYSVISVTVDGSNVVNQSQQRFYTYPTENWPISLLLYSLSVTAKDGIFSLPVGKSVNVVFPDGRVQNYPLDQTGYVVIHSLARGNYSTELVGSLGLKNVIPVALSRNQDVRTNVITYLDLTVVSLLAVLIALGLLLYGRPSLYYLLRSVLGLRGSALDPAAFHARSVPAPLNWAAESNTGELYDYRNLRYENVKMFDDEAFKRTIGVERATFEKMLSFLQNELKGNGRPSKLNYADQLLLTIVYFREHPAKIEIAPAYGVSQGTVRRTIKRVKDALMKSGEFSFGEQAGLALE